MLEGANSRWRLGIAPCLEVLADLPNYVDTLHGAGGFGFGDVAPAVKWQLNLPQSKFNVSVTPGAALPTGAIAVSGRGVQPYVQMPWSFALGSGWALTGMATTFFAPDADVKSPINRRWWSRKKLPNAVLCSLSMSAPFRRAAAAASCSTPAPVIVSMTRIRSIFMSGSALTAMRRPMCWASPIRFASTACSDVPSST